MIKEKQKMSLMKKSIVFISIAAALIAALSITLFFVLDIANTKSYKDPIDEKTYYIIKKDNVWSMYHENKEDMLPFDSKYDQFITDSGVRVEINRETGAIIEVVIVDGTVDTEVIEQNFRTLMFPHIEYANLRSVEVHNSYDTFTFLRYDAETGLQSDDGDFVIYDGIQFYPHISYNQDLFASLYVTAGYTLTIDKVEDPIKDENGEFSEYGLVPEKRRVEVLDEDGEFVLDENGDYIYEEIDYVPAYYIITDMNGNSHKVLIGDRIIPGGGYYVQYVDISDGEDNAKKRDAVYILNPEVGTSMLVPIENFISPTLTYPMSSSDYFEVDNFTINKKNSEKENGYEEVVSFSYIDFDKRENTSGEHISYKFHGDVLNSGYFPSTSITTTLQNLYNPDFTKVKKFAPSDKDLAEYGFYTEKDNADGKTEYIQNSDYVVTFDYDIKDSKGNISETISQMIIFVHDKDSGNYYAFTSIYQLNENGTKTFLYTYNMIVEIKAHSLAFLEWDLFKWVNESLVIINIGFIDQIEISAPGYNATFIADNSESNQDSEKLDTTKISINATDSEGNKMQTFSHKTFKDKEGNLWDVTSTKVSVTSPSGEEVKAGGKYTKNILGDQVYALNDPVETNDGTKVYIYADEVVFTYIDGKTERFVRYDTMLFGDLYQTLAWAALENSYPMTDAEEEALIKDTSKWQLTFTIKDINGNENKYSFYYLTSRKSYVVVNGDGGFYMRSETINKIISDTKKFFDLQPIDSMSSN